MYMNLEPKPLFIHIISCVAFMALPILFAPGPLDIRTFSHPRVQQEIFSYLLMLSFFYLNYYYLIPKFYIPKKYTQYIGLIIFCGILICLVPKVWMPDHPPMPRPEHRQHFFDLFALSHSLFL